jgi:hypothetical protein
MTPQGNFGAPEAPLRLDHVVRQKSVLLPDDGKIGSPHFAQYRLP